MKQIQKVTYISRLQALAGVFPVWPPVQDIRLSASTINVFEHLESSAEVMAGLRQPQWTVYNKGFTNQRAVYKREGSVHGIHMLRGRDNPRSAIIADMTDPQTSWRWIEEERVRLLANAGQIRVFMSGGRLTHVIHTTRVGAHLEGTPVRCVLDAKDVL